MFDGYIWFGNNHNMTKLCFYPEMVLTTNLPNVKMIRFGSYSVFFLNLMRKHHLLRESPIIFLHDQKTNIRINRTEKDGDCILLQTLYSFKVFWMIKQIIVISSATIQCCSKVKTWGSSNSRSSTSRERNTGLCVKTLIRWK